MSRVQIACALALALIACDDEPAPVDSGTDAGAPVDSGIPPEICMGDPSGTPPTIRDPGPPEAPPELDCGTPEIVDATGLWR